MPDTPTLVLLSRSSRRAALVQAGLSRMEERGWGRLMLLVHPRTDVWMAEASNPRCEIAAVDAAVSDPPSRSLDLVAHFQRQAPFRPILLLASGSELAARDWKRAGEIGVTEILMDQESSAAVAVARCIRALSGIGRAQEAIQILEGQVPSQWVKLLERALPFATRANADSDGLSAAILADLWIRGATPKQLAWRLSKDGKWNPGWLVRWLTCLRACTLRQLRPSWNAVASDLGFYRRDELRAYVVRLTGENEDGLGREGLIELLLERRRYVPEANQRGGETIPGNLR
ncbi:MAG: hypothetical protein EA422_13630 [Gemmatimonadales bacterium]|nr:MAG: hypothetical protein EA422_13630 [Gemmatimonadales bacterium]